MLLSLPRLGRRIFFLSQMFLLAYSVCGSDALAQNILIFSPAEKALIETKKKNIIFEVEISAFSPILVVRINGQIQRTVPGLWVRLRIPYRLKPGENVIIVDASTQFNTESKEFIIKHKTGEEKEERKKFQLIGVVGNQKSSNVLKVPESEPTRAGSRNFLVLLPRYDWYLTDDSAVRFQSVISRDQYSEKTEDLQAEEIAFTQFSVGWLGNFGKEDFWSAGLGKNYIYQKYKSLAQGEIKLEEDTYLFANIQQKLGKTGLYGLSLELKSQDFTAEAALPEEEEDGRTYTLGFRTEANFSIFRGKAKLGYLTNSAEGKLKSKTVPSLGGELSLPLGSFITGLGFRAKKTKYKEANPSLGDVVPEETLITYVFNVLYMISTSWMITSEYLTENQTANVDSSAYSNKSMSGSLIFIF